MTDDWFSRFDEKIDQLPRSSPEEIAQHKATWEAAKGTMNESAMMMENGEIAVKTWCYGHDGVIGDGWLTFLPDDENYEEAKKQYGLRKPGDRYYVIKKWKDDDWVVVEEKRPDESDAENDAGKAKSA